MATTNEIKNLALFELGFINEVDFNVATNKTVILVNRVYDLARETSLQRYSWGFARKVLSSSSPTTLTDEKYRYRHDLPTDFLGYRHSFVNKGLTSAIKDYEVKASDTDAGIYVNSESIWLEYTYDIDDENLPQYYVNYFKYRLALDMCFNLTGDPNLESKLTTLEATQYIKAKNIEAKQKRTKRIVSSPFVDIRH